MISIIIPTYNRKDFLIKAIKSIDNQLYEDKEIIVIDDNSTDNYKDILNINKHLKIRYIKNKINMGPGYSRKLGLSVCSGEFVIFMDDDDYYIDNQFFNKAINILENNDDIIFVSANAKKYYLDDEEYQSCTLNVVGRIDSIEYLKGFCIEYDKPLSTFTTVFKKEILLKSKMLDMEMVNDMSIYMRTLFCGNTYFLSDVVGVYSIHKNNISKNITSDFLLKNLEEKKYVFNYIKMKNLFNDYDEWWLEQIKITISYYVYGTKPKMSELIKVYWWCINNSKNKHKINIEFKKYMNYLLDLKICNFKLKIKKILRLEKNVCV